MAACIGLTGCASILGSSHKTVKFTSDPPGVTVRVKDARSGAVVQSGTTPFETRLPTSADLFEPASYTVECNKPGYIRTQAPFKAKLSLWYPTNLLFGCLPGLLFVDPLTGAMWQLERRYHANLALDPQ